MDLFWIALLAIMLGGYGLLRGFARDTCIGVILVATGVMLAQLLWLDRYWAYLLAALLTVVTVIGCIREGQHTRTTGKACDGTTHSRERRTRRPVADRGTGAEVTARRHCGRDY